MLCYAMLCYAMSYRVVFCHIMLRSIPEQGMMWMEEIEGQRTVAAEDGRLHGLNR